MQQRERIDKTMINMRTTTRKIANSCKHKRCKTNKIKIMMTKKVTNNYSEKKGEGRQRST